MQNNDKTSEEYIKRKQWRRLVWPLAIAQTLIWAGIYYMFPALLRHWEQDFGWSKTELALAFTSALIISALVAPFAGRLIDLDHGRKVLAIGSFCGGLLVALLAWVEHFWQFYLIWLALGVVMACALYEACFCLFDSSAW